MSTPFVQPQNWPCRSYIPQCLPCRINFVRRFFGAQARPFYFGGERWWYPITWNWLPTPIDPRGDPPVTIFSPQTIFHERHTQYISDFENDNGRYDSRWRCTYDVHCIGQCQRCLRSPKTSLVTVYRLYIVAFQIRRNLNELSIPRRRQITYLTIPIDKFSNLHPSHSEHSFQSLSRANIGGNAERKKGRLNNPISAILYTYKVLPLLHSTPQVALMTVFQSLLRVHQLPQPLIC